MKISVAMATCNGERFLIEQLDSIAAQTLVPDEIVIADDSSDDGTIAVVEDWARSAPLPVRLYRNAERLGYSQNFAKALALATGSYVFISDQDDVWFPEKVRSMVERMEQPDRPLLVVCDQLFANADAVPVGESMLGRLRRRGSFGVENLVSGCATAIHTSLLSIVLPIPKESAYDSWIHRIAQSIGRRSLIEVPLQLYRRHSGAVGARSVFTAHRASSWATVMWYYLQGDSVDVCARRLRLLDVLAARLSSETASSLFLSEKERTTRLSHIQKEREFLLDRLRVLVAPFPKRWIGALAIWRAGGYQYASGLRSFLKDCLVGARGKTLT